MMLKEMQVIWDKFQNPELSLDDVTKEEIQALKVAMEKVDVKNLTSEEKDVRELLQRVDLKKHKAVVGGLYNLFIYD